MKRFISILLAGLILCAACVFNASAAPAAPKKTFNPDAIQQCTYLNDTEGITGNGHCGVLLVDSAGYGRLYHFIRSGLMKVPFTPAQVQQFMKDGHPFPGSEFQFNRAVIFGITPEEGRRMYDHAENTEFKEFYREASFWVIPIEGDNCLTVARSITSAGSRKYDFIFPFGLPNSTFYTMQLSLLLNFVPYTTQFPGETEA